MRKVLYILGQLSDDDVEWLSKAGKRLRPPPGTVLIKQGAKIDAMYVLLDGRVSVSLDKIGEVAILNTGEIVGEMSLVDARPPSATVTTIDSCLLLEISRQAIEEKLAKDVPFAARFYRAIATFLSDRLRGTVQRLGYGGEGGLDENVELEGELDLNVLDNVHLAGARFERMLKKMMGGE
jgi:CRP/FNR family cyclic AMP-dependent transcriptional regulator